MTTRVNNSCMGIPEQVPVRLEDRPLPPAKEVICLATKGVAHSKVPVRFRFSFHNKPPWVGFPEVLHRGRGAAVSEVIPDGQRVTVQRAYVHYYDIYVSVQSRTKGWATIGIIQRRKPLIVERAGNMLIFPGLEPVP